MKQQEGYFKNKIGAQSERRKNGIIMHNDCMALRNYNGVIL